MCAATMQAQAQKGNTNNQSVLKQIALNDKEDAEIKMHALTKITDQNVFRQIAANDKEENKFRKYALSRINQ